MNKAIVRTATGKVLSIIRPDVPVGFAPPNGCHVVDENKLPQGWEYEEQKAPIPQTITAVQLKRWLLRADLMTSVDAAINSLPDFEQKDFQIMWEYETLFARDNPELLKIAAAINMSDEAIDTAFCEAVKL